MLIYLPSDRSFWVYLSLARNVLEVISVPDSVSGGFSCPPFQDHTKQVSASLGVVLDVCLATTEVCDYT